MKAPRPGWPRLAASLALSGALHILLGSQLGGRTALDASTPQPLTVRLPALAKAPATALNTATPDTGASTELLAALPADADTGKASTANGDHARTLQIVPAKPPAADDRYYPASKLDEYPFAQGLIPLHPPSLDGYPDSGTLQVDLWISDSGTVDRVAVAPSPLPLLFSEVARQAFAAARFMPGRRDGHPVACHVHIEVEYAAKP